jgi:hypothetical protein
LVLRESPPTTWPCHINTNGSRRENAIRLPAVAGSGDLPAYLLKLSLYPCKVATGGCPCGIELLDLQSDLVGPLERIERTREIILHVWRVQIVLLTAAGLGTNEIVRQTGKSKTCVWRWQERFVQAGVDGLLHDKTRPSRVPPLALAIGEQVVALTQGDPPGETTHWTAAAMAARVQPHRVRQFKLSRDPDSCPSCATLSGSR